MSDILHEVVYEDETGVLYLEYHPYYGAIIHCIVKQWSKETSKHFLSVWVEFLNSLEDKGYKKLYAMTGDKKLRKFAVMYGFETTDTYVTDNKGTEREVMVCHLV